MFMNRKRTKYWLKSRKEWKLKKDWRRKTKEGRIITKKESSKVFDVQKSISKKKSTTCTVNRIRCDSCEEELTNDTDINDLKNIGCDNCPAWYHLKCTIFAGEDYENVYNKEFVCPTCNNK